MVYGLKGVRGECRIVAFLQCGKRCYRPVENSVHVGEDHAVIADGDACFDGGAQALVELFAGDHAAAALDDHRILLDVRDLV